MMIFSSCSRSRRPITLSLYSEFSIKERFVSFAQAIKFTKIQDASLKIRGCGKNKSPSKSIKESKTPHSNIRLTGGFSPILIKFLKMFTSLLILLAFKPSLQAFFKF